MSLALSGSRARRISYRGGRTIARTARGRPSLWLAVICLFGLLSLASVVFVGAAIWLIVWFGAFAGTLPTPEQLTARAPFQTTPVFADDGTTVLYEITDPQGGRRTVIKLSHMPRYLIEATIATEDAGFFSNPGFEPRAIFRAAIEDLTHQQLLSGASTITQQVVRNVLLTPQERLDRSARRKIKEIILAYQLTHTYTKDEILSVYLNQIFYGNRSYGVEAAAEGYFGKPAARLDLAECAFLAGLPRAPSYYDPYRRFDIVKQRQEYVLQRMVEQGYITEQQAQAAASEPLHFVDRNRAPVAPHFVNYVADQLRSELGTDRLYHAGYHVITTLDLPLQNAAERAISTNRALLAKGSGNNAALVALDPRTGDILAMVGSANYDDPSIAGEVNMAFAPRPSAGILTPLTYAIALDHGQTLLSRVVDEPIGGSVAGAGGVGRPASTLHRYLGPVTLREALARGLAAPALRLLGTIGNQSLIDVMTASGITDFARHVQFAPGFVIGGASVSPMEVAQAYGMLAADGVAHQPIAIARVVDPQNQTVLRSQPRASRVLPAGVAYLVTSALSDPSARPAALQRVLQLQQTVAVHSTISDDHLDSWAAGYVSNLVVVVWVGNTNGHAVSDPEAAAEIWGDFVREATHLRPPSSYVRPPDVIQLSLCQNAGCTSKHTEDVLKGTEKAAEDANAAWIGRPPRGVTNSLTPLVDRARPPISQPGLLPPGATSIIIPDVSGTTPDEARLRLGAAGLAIATQVKYVAGADLPPAQRGIAVGQVVDTSPAAGESVAPGTRVVLTLRRD